MEALGIWDTYTDDWWTRNPGPFHNRASAEDAIFRYYREKGIEGLSIRELGFEIRTFRVEPEPLNLKGEAW